MYVSCTGAVMLLAKSKKRYVVIEDFVIIRSAPAEVADSDIDTPRTASYVSNACEL